MRGFLFVFLLFSAITGVAQKLVRKSILDDKISLVQIDADKCFKVLLGTSATNEILVEAQMDGEYSEDLELQITEKGNTLVISTDFRPSFANPNDKLSAHKVVSIALNIVVPEWKQVLLFGTNTGVKANGNYENLNIVLSDGTCELREVSQDIQVRTQSGDIRVYASSGSIKAKSRYGTINKNPIPNGSVQYNLNTVTGNIILSKTE